MTMETFNVFRERTDPLYFQNWQKLFLSGGEVDAGDNHFPMNDHPELVRMAIRAAAVGCRSKTCNTPAARKTMLHASLYV